jgi:hypothetical protein
MKNNDTTTNGNKKWQSAVVSVGFVLAKTFAILDRKFIRKSATFHTAKRCA